MQMEDYFADAADRLKNGEAIESILARYPAEARGELQSLLFVVELTERVATVAPPRRVPVNRISARVAFSHRAAELRAELEAAQRQVAAPALQSAPANAPESTRPWQPLWERIRERLAVWTSPGPLMRLAPLTILLIVVYLLTFSVVAMAQESLPGDIVYPMKEWIREQRVATAPAAQQAEARWRADQELAQDVAKAAEALQSEPDAKPQTVVSILQFRGFEEDKLLAGDLKVIPWHQPENAATDEWLPISIEGTLAPGAVVMLRYQIVPGTTDTVQGIALQVMQAPPMATPVPTVPPRPDPDDRCRRTQPVGWVRYVVKAGDTLSEIAARSDVTVAELRRFNCLTGGVLRTGTTIFVPSSIMGAVPSGRPPAVATAVAPPVIVPTATPAPTYTPSPPTTPPTITETPGAPESTLETTPAETPVDGAGGETTPVTTPIETGEPTTPTASETPETPVQPTVTDAPTGDATTPADTTVTPVETPLAPEPQVTPDAGATPTTAVEQPTAAAEPTTEIPDSPTEPVVPQATDIPAEATSAPPELPPTTAPGGSGSSSTSGGSSSSGSTDGGDTSGDDSSSSSTGSSGSSQSGSPPPPPPTQAPPPPPPPTEAPAAEPPSTDDSPTGDP